MFFVLRFGFIRFRGLRRIRIGICCVAQALAAHAAYRAALTIVQRNITEDMDRICRSAGFGCRTHAKLSLVNGAAFRFFGAHTATVCRQIHPGNDPFLFDIKNTDTVGRGRTVFTTVAEGVIDLPLIQSTALGEIDIKLRFELIRDILRCQNHRLAELRF